MHAGQLSGLGSQVGPGPVKSQDRADAGGHALLQAQAGALVGAVGLGQADATAAIGLGVTIYTVVLMVTSYVAGWVSDRTGRRKWLVVLSTVLFAIGTGALFFADTVPAFQPWRDVVDALADIEWPRLYDEAAIAASGVRGAAAVYVNDIYVPLGFSLETADLMPGVHPWITNEHEHSGLRSGEVLPHQVEDLPVDRAIAVRAFNATVKNLRAQAAERAPSF